jgi:hypothetical protein
MSNKKSFKRSKAGLLALTLAAGMGMGMLAAPAAWAANDDSRYEACPRCEPKNLVWSNGLFDQVYLVPGASNNAQPRHLNVDPLARLLEKLTQKSGGKTLSLLGDDTALELARGLVAAMDKANGQQDVAFFMTSRGNNGIFANRVGHSGTAFIDAKGLNLIFGEANVDFFVAWKASHISRPFDFGSRSKQSKVELVGEGVLHPRADWIIVPLGGEPAAQPSAPPVPPQTVGGGNTPAVAGSVQSVGGNVAPAPMAPAAPATPATPARDDAFFQAQEARLKGLKRLREQGLLTEEEFQAKRKEILKDL